MNTQHFAESFSNCIVWICLFCANVSGSKSSPSNFVFFYLYSFFFFLFCPVQNFGFLKHIPSVVGTLGPNLQEPCVSTCILVHCTLKCKERDHFPSLDTELNWHLNWLLHANRQIIFGDSYKTKPTLANGVKQIASSLITLEVDIDIISISKKDIYFMKGTLIV